MSQNNKKDMVALIERCLKVIDEEIKNLDDWANKTTSMGRQARCLKRKTRIRQGPRPKVQKLLQKAKGTDANKVKTAPGATHRSMVAANERSLAIRKMRNVNQISNEMFTQSLDRAETNSKDSVKDARVILHDCTK